MTPGGMSQSRRAVAAAAAALAGASLAACSLLPGGDSGYGVQDGWDLSVPGTEVWTTDLGGAEISQVPVVSGDAVLFGGDGGAVVGLEDGIVRWSREAINFQDSTDCLVNTAVVCVAGESDEDVIVIADGDGDEQQVSRPDVVGAIDVGDDIIVANSDGTLERLTPDGESVWRATIDTANDDAPYDYNFLTVLNDTLYGGAGFSDGQWFAVDIDTGEQLADVETVVVRLPQGFVGYSFNDDGLALLADQYDVNGELMAAQTLLAIDDAPVGSPNVTLIDGEIVIADGDQPTFSYPESEVPFAHLQGRFVSVDFTGDEPTLVSREADGTEVWRTPGRDIALASADVIVTTSRAPESPVTTWTAVDLATGEHLWSLEVDRWAIWSLTDDGVIIVDNDTATRLTWEQQ